MEKAQRIVDDSFLAVHPAKRWVHDRIVDLLSSELVLPSFSVSALRLANMARNETLGLDDLAAVVSLDQGISARCLRAACSPSYGGHDFSSIKEALWLLGVREMRRIAITVAVINNFNHLRIKVDWQAFWLHSVLVARLSEKLANAFGQMEGTGYLGGLIHDIGKLILQHYFPREFEAIVIRAMERQCNHATAEFDILGLDHTCIGAALCKCLNLHHHIVGAVRFHHQATHPAHTSDPQCDRGLLASCISVADSLANMANVNIVGAAKLASSLDALEEWKYLTTFFECRGLQLDLDEETASAVAEINSLVGSSMSVPDGRQLCG
jgi:putative nucleotidyltransferase with HDIG domain